MLDDKSWCLIVNVSSEFLDSIKLFLRVDGTDNDEIVQELILHAVAYVVSSTGQLFQESNQLQIMCVKLLVRHWFDGNERDVPYGIQSLLTQISYSPTLPME